MNDGIRSPIRTFSRVLAQARAMHMAGETGMPLRDALRHARALLDVIETEINAGPVTQHDKLSRDLLSQMRDRLDATEALLPLRH